MTTPPRPTRAEYDAALDRIQRRRRAAGDDHPLAGSEDPRDVLAHLRRRGHAGLLVDEHGDDLTDALTLRLWLWWEGEAAELWLLEAAEKLGRNRKVVGAVLGLDSGQGLVDRIRGLNRKLDRAPADDRPAVEPGRHAEVRQLAAELVAHRAAMPAEVAEDLDMVAEALESRWPPGAPPPSAGIVNALRFALGDLTGAVAPGTALSAVVAHGAALLGVRRV